MKYTSGYKYQVYEDVWIWTNIHPLDNIITPFTILFVSGWMLVKKGYAWDGPSGPTIDTPDTLTPSLFHDAIYQLIREEMLDPRWKVYADEWLGKMMEDRSSDVPPLRFLQSLRARYWVAGVKNLSGGAASPSNRKKIYEVA